MFVSVRLLGSERNPKIKCEDEVVEQLLNAITSITTAASSLSINPLVVELVASAIRSLPSDESLKVNISTKHYICRILN